MPTTDRMASAPDKWINVNGGEYCQQAKDRRENNRNYESKHDFIL